MDASRDNHRSQSRRARFDRGVLKSVHTVLEVIVLLAVLVASTLIAKELWPRSARATGSPSVPAPTELISTEGASQKGNPGAVAVMIIYSDFQCPFCGSFARDALPQIEEDYVRTGKLRLVFRNMPIEAIHPLAFNAAVAGMCANQQGRFWQWHDALFGSGSAPDHQVLLSISATVGLDTLKFNNCLERGDFKGQVRREIQDATALRITSTPTFILGQRQDAEIVKPIAVVKGSRPVHGFKVAIEDVLGRIGTRPLSKEDR